MRWHATELQRIDAAGKMFDPHVHQAIERVESKEYPDGSIVDVFQDGYMFHGRVLRPAIVRVAVHPGDAANAGTQRRTRASRLHLPMSQKRDCYEVLGIERAATRRRNQVRLPQSGTEVASGPQPAEKAGSGGKIPGGHGSLFDPFRPAEARRL